MESGADTAQRSNGKEYACVCDICAGIAYICPICREYRENNYEGPPKKSLKNEELLICPKCYENEEQELDNDKK